MASKRPAPSAAERTLRKHIAAIVKRVSSGAAPLAAIAASGYTWSQAARMLRLADGGMPDMTDDGYRNACKLLRSKIDRASAEQDAALAERWRELAMEGDDWRSIAELLRRRNPDEWAVTERSEIALDADVTTRSEDAVLAALVRLKAETATGDDDGEG